MIVNKPTATVTNLLASAPPRQDKKPTNEGISGMQSGLEQNPDGRLRWQKNMQLLRPPPYAAMQLTVLLALQALLAWGCIFSMLGLLAGGLVATLCKRASPPTPRLLSASC